MRRVPAPPRRILALGLLLGSSLAGVPSVAADEPLVIFLGDSLTAGLGLAQAEAFPARVEELLLERGIEIRVVNAGISGDTSAGGLGRLAWLMRQRPTVLVVGLGANDGLRGLPLGETEENLRRIVTGARDGGAEVLLLGMKIPPSYGREYVEGFEAIFPALAGELEVPLVPFLLAGVAADPELNQADGIHPNAEGHRIMAELVAPHLIDLLR